MDIKPYEKNAKKHPDKQLKQIAKSLKEFGWQQPIVIDKEGTIIVGHGRWAAYQRFKEQMNLPEPDIRTADLTEEQAKAYRLADNKLNESDWDMELLIEELKELSDEMLDLTGFDKDLILESDEKDDEVPELPEEPKSQRGEIYQLGKHFLMCGDATSEEDVAKLMNEQKADMIFTDPPYNINYKGQGKNTSEHIMSDNVLVEEFQEFLNKTFKNYKEHSKSSAGVYVFHASRTQAQFENAMQDNDYEIKNQIIWNKPMSALGWGDYRWKHEPFFYASRKGTETQFYGDRTHSTVWDFQKSDKDLLRWAKAQKKAEQEGKTTIWSMKRDNVHEYKHPTQKPVELITYAIKNSTKADDIIMDLFAGSGSTLIAAEKTGRVCYGMEMDPKYIDTIIERWENYTGGKAVKL